MEAHRHRMIPLFWISRHRSLRKKCSSHCLEVATAQSAERAPESPDTSLNLNSFDPNLAALLKPNRMKISTERLRCW
ncbi:hypothetical protein C8Q74DRAFT_345128 [Fomes fomentarius]|nr:hypothetical protein C8Q74DRAFT_345128 [Fomes fomentarius]